MPAKSPDDSIIALFKNHAIPNPAKTAKEGRPVFDDMEICEIRIAGSRNVSAFPATAVSHWIDDVETGAQIPVTYAERFAPQYRQFKAHDAQTKSGTPLTHVNFLTEARRAEMRALNIYTVEALAHVDGQELKNLGHGGRDLKNKAMEYLAEARSGAVNTQMAAELEASRARIAVLEEDLERAKLAKANTAGGKPDAFADMSLEQLRGFIEEETGHAPAGNLNRKTLVRMATEAQQKAA